MAKVDRWNAVWLIAVCGVLVWIYSYGLRSNPLTWEEPRRSLVALEMILTGDYLVPHVLSEPYLNKPPLQNWLIVLLSSNDPANVGPFVIRLLSLMACGGTAALLWLLARRVVDPSRAWVPPAAFLSSGVVVQYGRSGEIDALFTFWVVAAFACFELGRRSGRPGLQWVVSQLCVAGGILTKGIAPIFFYPPVLYLAWRKRSDRSGWYRPFLLGLCAELAVVGAWLIPYASRSSLGSLISAWTSEVVTRTPIEESAFDLLVHLASYPPEMAGAVLPWSFLLGPLFIRRVRAEFLRAVGDDRVLQLAFTASVWSFGLFWLMPGARTRYLLPAFAMASLLTLPILSALRSGAPTRRPLKLGAYSLLWLAVIVGWSVGIAVAMKALDLQWSYQPVLVGVVALGAGAVGMRTTKMGFVHALLTLGLAYGVAYSGVVRVKSAQADIPSLLAAQRIAESIEGPLPVVCSDRLAYRECFEVSRRLGRPLLSRPPDRAEHLRIDLLDGRLGEAPGTVAEFPPLGLWRVSVD